MGYAVLQPERYKAPNTSTQLTPFATSLCTEYAPKQLQHSQTNSRAMNLMHSFRGIPGVGHDASSDEEGEQEFDDPLPQPQADFPPELPGIAQQEQENDGQVNAIDAVVTPSNNSVWATGALSARSILLSCIPLLVVILAYLAPMAHLLMMQIIDSLSDIPLVASQSRHAQSFGWSLSRPESEALANLKRWIIYLYTLLGGLYLLKIFRTPAMNCCLTANRAATETL
ncbi:hypothetical protein BDV93DRAFT_519233 [Ceratobasidium sp. AG-I]|nr:hypothetical protein BDV93DRAFT_519233 [Ceratobasidium sp. AG-I]